MLTKLSIRNAKRSWKNYLIFFLTLALVTALIFSFFGLFFHMEILEDMKPLLYVATGFILVVTAWLIQYMIRFMILKRSREFATYLLLGMRRRQISGLFWRESLWLGAAAFACGILTGVFLQQFLFACFYALIGLEYRIALYWDGRCLAITAVCMFFCYFLALLFQGKQFVKMSIMELMKAQQQAEQVREDRGGWGSLAFAAGLAYIVFFCKSVSRQESVLSVMAGAGGAALRMLGLIPAVYLIYAGLASFFCLFIRTGYGSALKGSRLFLLRQLSSKIRTVRFTCGTLTLLFALALMGCGMAMIINDYRTGCLWQKYPFSVNVVNGPEQTMEAEREVILAAAPSAGICTCKIYQNGTDDFAVYFYTHLNAFGGKYVNADGSFKRKAAMESHFFYEYDTFMKLSDYNALRRLLGLEDAKLPENGYLLHMRKRLLREAGDDLTDIVLYADGHELHYAGAYTEEFAQDGYNGADYLVIVADELAEKMEVYYSGLAALVPDGLSEDEISGELWQVHASGWHLPAWGTDMTNKTFSPVFVSDEAYRDEVNAMFVGIVFPLLYVGLVYLCVAFTVLSVQQLNDSEKYRYCVWVLSGQGMDRTQIRGLILKQMTVFYLCPVLPAVLISASVTFSLWKIFHNFSDLTGNWIGYFGSALILFLGIYLIYFVIAYVSFVREVQEG